LLCTNKTIPEHDDEEFGLPHLRNKREKKIMRPPPRGRKRKDRAICIALRSALMSLPDDDEEFGLPHLRNKREKK
jgi:hypothetical protein